MRIRNCDYCNKEYKADERNIKRGWGLCCSKSCAALKREKSKSNSNSMHKLSNNSDENLYGVYTGRRTSEGYKIYRGVHNDFTAVDEFDDPVYTLNDYDDDYGDSEY